MAEKNRRINFKVIDSSLRELPQSPEMFNWGPNPSKRKGKILFATEDKLRILESLIVFGVRIFEVYAPNVNAAERNDLPIILKMKNELSKTMGIPILALAHTRLDIGDIEPILKLPIDGLNLYFRGSDESRGVKGVSIDGIHKKAIPLLEEIKRNYPHLILRFSAEDAYRAKINDLIRIYQPITELVHKIGIPDTVGVATPDKVKRLIRKLKEQFPNTPLEAHFHNDRGLSLINALTAVEEGVEYIDTTILGLGERSGITSLTALLFNLFLKRESFVEGFDIKYAYALNVLIADMLGNEVPASEPVSMTNTIDTAGAHAAGSLTRDSQYYHAHRDELERFGVTGNTLLLGPLSGWHTINYFLREILGYPNVTPEIAKKITKIFKDRTGELLNSLKTPIDLLDSIATGEGLSNREK